MALNAAAILAGWHEASNRLSAYMALAGLGVFVSLLFHAHLSLRESKRRRNESSSGICETHRKSFKHKQSF